MESAKLSDQGTGLRSRNRASIAEFEPTSHDFQSDFETLSSLHQIIRLCVVGAIGLGGGRGYGGVGGSLVGGSVGDCQHCQHQKIKEPRIPVLCLV